MSDFQIGGIHCRETSHGWEVAIPVSIPGKSRVVEFRFPAAAGEPVCGDAILCLFLMPAMATHRDVCLLGPISPALRRHLEKYQAIYHTWNHDYRTCRIEAIDGPDMPLDAPRGVALLFSGGIDSMFSLAQNNTGLTDLVFVSGFDVAPDHGAHARKAVENARAVANEQGLGFVQVETDARFSGDRNLRWADYGGSVLGAVAMLLRPLFHTVRVAPDYAWDDLRQESVHPSLHECWRTEDTRMVCDSAACNRAEKCASSARPPIRFPCDRWRSCRSGFPFTGSCWQQPTPRAMPPGAMPSGIVSAVQKPGKSPPWFPVPGKKSSAPWPGKTTPDTCATDCWIHGWNLTRHGSMPGFTAIESAGAMSLSQHSWPKANSTTGGPSPGCACSAHGDNGCKSVRMPPPCRKRRAGRDGLQSFESGGLGGLRDLTVRAIG